MNKIKKISSFDHSAAGKDLGIKNQVLYVAAGKRGLLILNILVS
jgi:hypothetical protein